MSGVTGSAAAVASSSGLLRLWNAPDSRSSWRFVEPSASSPFVARRTENSGVGLYAARYIRAGERLLAEVPLATWCGSADATSAEKLRSFEALAEKLPPRTIKAILQLSQSPKYGSKQTLLGTWQTNALPINYENDARPGTVTSELLRKKEAAVFATISRINHSCQPCCHAEWNSKLGRETVHALFDIPAGTELSICYLAPRGMERAVRRALLLEDHGFECHCPKCELSGEALALSESRQRAIGEFLRPAESRLPVVQLHQRLQLRLQFMRDEGLPPLWAWKPVLFPLMSASMTELMRAPADQVSRRRVVDWAARASKAVRCGLGDDHPAAEFLAQFIAST